MTSEEKSTTGSDVSDVVSGTLGDTIVSWLNACAANEIEPRLSCKTNEVTLKAGPRAWSIACTPESMMAALLPFKGDARFQRSGVKRNGYTSCVYLLNHPKDVPYVANGHARTTGTHQTAGNTQTRTLGSVAKAEAAKNKAFDKMNAAELAFNRAKEVYVEAKAAVIDAQKAEELHAAQKAEAAKAEAKANRTALLAKAEALRAKAAKAAKEAAELDALLAEAEAA